MAAFYIGTFVVRHAYYDVYMDNLRVLYYENEYDFIKGT